MRAKKVVWRGRKEEGMSYRQKVKLLEGVQILLVLNELAMREPLRTKEKLSAERAEKIKRVYGKGLRKSVKLFRLLPTELLEGTENIEAFSFGYFSAEVREKVENYYKENTL